MGGCRRFYTLFMGQERRSRAPCGRAPGPLGRCGRGFAPPGCAALASVASSSPNRKKPPPRREQPFLLQLFVVGTDILIVPVLHPEALGNGTQLDKAQPLVEVPGVQVGGYYGIKLQYHKAMLFALL